MDSSFTNRILNRSSRRALTQRLGIVLLLLALVSSPFQYALASCDCRGCQCCPQSELIECCGSSTSCGCLALTSSSEGDTAEACCSSCSNCGSQCQCGALEVTSSENQIGQTETAGSPLLISKLAPLFVERRQSTPQTSSVRFPDLVSLRLHAFLCVWLN